MEEILVDAGVENAVKLKELGAAKAAFKVYQQNPESVMRLAALEGALQGTRWHNISDHDKAQLESQFRELCMEQQ